MPSFTFGVFFTLVMATIAFYVAPDLANHGNVVAQDICRSGATFCQHPEYVAVSALGAGLLWITTYAIYR
jgi:hypothetical protein